MGYFDSKADYDSSCELLKKQWFLRDPSQVWIQNLEDLRIFHDPDIFNAT